MRRKQLAMALLPIITLVLALTVGVTACGDNGGGDGGTDGPCSNIGCSGHGTCDDSVDPPVCDCDLGFEFTAPDSCTQIAGVTQMRLEDVQYWAYNIQEMDSARQRDELVGTHFDLYVLEVSTTEEGNESFDMADLISDIRQHNIDTRNVNPLVVAYVDVGQAEEWRWYYDSSWELGDPDWLVADDPNGWVGNFVVAYWDSAWEDIVIYGDADERSVVQETLDHGFDGIYMDWVEAFSDEHIIAKLEADLGLSTEDAEQRAADLMLDFIEKIGDYARSESPTANPEYLIIAQNASDLHGWDPVRYGALMDGIALEAIWIDGDGGFDDWEDPQGYNVWTNSMYPGWTEEVLADLQPLKAVMPIFCVEYAQDMGGEDLATEVYDVLAPGEGFIPYATRRSLARLSTTPYPSGYTPLDY